MIRLSLWLTLRVNCSVQQRWCSSRWYSRVFFLFFTVEWIQLMDSTPSAHVNFMTAFAACFSFFREKTVHAWNRLCFGWEIKTEQKRHFFAFSVGCSVAGITVETKGDTQGFRLDGCQSSLKSLHKRQWHVRTPTNMWTQACTPHLCMLYHAISYLPITAD